MLVVMFGDSEILVRVALVPRFTVGVGLWAEPAMWTLLQYGAWVASSVGLVSLSTQPLLIQMLLMIISNLKRANGVACLHPNLSH